MQRRMTQSLFILIALLVNWSAAYGQDNFYRGKTLRLIVGASAGGGYDTYTRTVARHMGKHIPGNPTLVVDNMPGAGFLISANYMYKIAKPDGLTIGHFIGGLFLQQLLGKPGVEFDAQSSSTSAFPGKIITCLAWPSRRESQPSNNCSPPKRRSNSAASAPGRRRTTFRKSSPQPWAFHFSWSTGYKGTADVRLAFDSGEVQGICNSWESLKATWSKELASGEIVVILQTTAKSHPDLPKVPLVIEYAKTDEAQQFVKAIVHSVGPTARPYVLPPERQRTACKFSAKAFMDTKKDADFLADATKARLDINPARRRRAG